MLSLGIKQVKIKVDKGQMVDTAEVYFDIVRKPWYLNYGNHDYAARRNTLDFNLKLV